MLKLLTERLGKLTSRQLLALAFAASLVFALSLYIYLSGLQGRQAVKPQQLEMIVVAAVDIPERAVIQESMLKTAAMPAELVPSGALRDSGAAVGKIAKSRLFRGDPLTGQKLFAAAGLAGFTGKIPPDKRAISVAITDITGVSGFVQPGDSVDVMLIADKTAGSITATLLLQDILLLAVNRSSDSGGSQKEPLTTATLAVAPQEALRLGAAQLQGKLYLVLRPLNSQGSMSKVRDFTTQRPEQAPQQPGQMRETPPGPPPSAPGAPTRSIPVIRGNSVSLEAVR